MGDIDVPAGTTVGTQGWSMARVQDVWRDADDFEPERWINTSADELSDMQV